jgi:hypothetical protein
MQPEISSLSAGLSNHMNLTELFIRRPVMTTLVMLAIQKQPGTTTVEVVDAIKLLLARLRAEIPPAASSTAGR